MKRVKAKVEPVVVVTAGDGMMETVLGMDGSGQELRAEVPYREMVFRRAQAGQVSCFGGYATVSPTEQALFSFKPEEGQSFVLRAKGDDYRFITWAVEWRREDGIWAVYAWDATSSAHWDIPEAWFGEAPVAEGMPWLHLYR